MEVMPLGTNGFFASFGRQTACFAISFGKTLILLDAGTGLFRLAEKEGQKLLKRKREIHLFLSHYHLDHTFGFYAAFKLLKKKKVIVYSFDGRRIFSEFPELKHFPIDYSKEHQDFSFRKIREEKMLLGSYQVSALKQNHRGEISLAFRFSFLTDKKVKKDLVYATDGEPTRGLVKFSKDADILLIEHSEAGKRHLDKRSMKLKDHIFDGHITTVGAAKIAKKADVGKLVLIHHKAFLENNKLQRQLALARKIFSKTILAKDLEKITF